MILRTSAQYYVFIVTSRSKTLLEIGVTGDIARAVKEREQCSVGMCDDNGKEDYCFNLVWFERHPSAKIAVQREDNLEKMSRSSLRTLISHENPEWRFLNEEVFNTGEVTI